MNIKLKKGHTIPCITKQDHLRSYISLLCVPLKAGTGLSTKKGCLSIKPLVTQIKLKDKMALPLFQSHMPPFPPLSKCVWQWNIFLRIPKKLMEKHFPSFRLYSCIHISLPKSAWITLG